MIDTHGFVIGNSTVGNTVNDCIGGKSVSVNTSLTGSVASVGTVIKKTQLSPLVGNASPVGTILKNIIRLFNGSIASSGISLKDIQIQSLVGSTTLNGQLLKDIEIKRFSSIGSSGTLSTQLITNLISRLFLGSITPTGQITDRHLIKVTHGNITPGGNIVKLLLKSLNGSITPFGLVRKNSTIHLQGSINPNGLFNSSRIYQLILQGLIQPSADLLTALLIPNDVIIFPQVINTILHIFDPHSAGILERSHSFDVERHENDFQVEEHKKSIEVDTRKSILTELEITI